MTAVEDLRSFAAIAEAHAADTRSFMPAFEALYRAMPAEQQAPADRIFRAIGSKSTDQADGWLNSRWPGRNKACRMPLCQPQSWQLPLLPNSRLCILRG
jgi:hypothetical protein